MRTNIVLDEKLVKKAFKHAPSVKTKKDLVHLALKEYVERRSRPNILDLVGENLIRSDYDPKAQSGEQSVSR